MNWSMPCSRTYANLSKASGQSRGVPTVKTARRFVRFWGALMGASSADAVQSHQAPRRVAVLEQLWCLLWLSSQQTSPFLHVGFSLGADWPLQLGCGASPVNGRRADEVCDQLTAKQSSRKTASRAVLVALARSARSLPAADNASDLKNSMNSYFKVKKS